MAASGMVHESPNVRPVDEIDSETTVRHVDELDDDALDTFLGLIEDDPTVDPGSAEGLSDGEIIVHTDYYRVEF